MWVDDLAQDLRFALRSARHAPLFTALTVVTLALGIGSNTAVFGVMKSVLLDALPYADASRLVRVYGVNNERPLVRDPVSAGVSVDIERRLRSFSHVAVFRQSTVEQTFEGPDRAQLVRVANISKDFFGTLGVGAALGRTISDRDAAPNAPAVAVLGHDAWQRLFAGDRNVIGRAIRLEGSPVTIVGVLPREFVGPMGHADVWARLDLSPFLGNPIGERRVRMLGVVGRLTPGVTPDAVAREIETLAGDLAREHPESDGGFTLASLPLRDDMVGDTRKPLLVVMASAALVLLITCANIAGALLSRTLSRRKEFAVRAAIGAGRARIVRQLLTESMALAIAGAVAGIGVALLGLLAARTLALGALPSYASFDVDPAVLVFNLGLALVTGLAFGLAPVMSVGRSRMHDVLQSATHAATEGRRSRQLRGLLVAGQIALSASLLAGAGLLARSLREMTVTPLGFDPNGVLTIPVRLPADKYRGRAARVEFHQRLEARLRGFAGVASVATTSALPAPVMGRSQFAIDGLPWPAGQEPFVADISVSEDYFGAMRIALREGRTFTAADRTGSTPVAIIGESIARRYWPNGNALGARIRVGVNANEPWRDVIGVVADVRNDPARPDPEPTIYSNRGPAGTTVIRVACAGAATRECDASALTPLVRRELAALDPAIPGDRVAPLGEVIATSLAGRRLPVMLMVAFAALALFLASVGVYAMFATMAAAREREFAVRVALGSTRARIAGLVLTQAATWVGLGLALAAVGVVAIARVLRGMLYGVSQYDAIALGGAVVLLVVCGVVALLVPMWRATRVDPIATLR